MKPSELLNRWFDIKERFADSSDVLPIDTRSALHEELTEIEEEMDRTMCTDGLADRLSVTLKWDGDFTGEGWDRVVTVQLALDGEVFSKTEQITISKG